MFEIILKALQSVFRFFAPVLVVITALFVFVFLVFLFWYLYFYYVEKMRLPENTEGSSGKRIPLWKQLLFEVPKRYWLDMFERPVDYFGVCGLHMFCGDQGSGKTIAMVELILRLQNKYPKSKTITNFGLKTETTALRKWQMLLTYVNGHYGVIAAIDEIQNWFKAGHNTLPDGMLEVVTQNRKNLRILLCTAQRFIRVAKGIREQVTLVYEPHTFLGCFTVVVVYKPIFDSEGNVKERKYRGIYSFVHTDELRNVYDTYKCIHMLAKDGFKESK